MSNRHSSNTPDVPKPRRRLRKVLVAVVVLALLLVGAWFVVTSTAFLKRVVLPQMGRQFCMAAWRYYSHVPFIKTVRPIPNERNLDTSQLTCL